jgi:hypothetical protein
MSLPEAPFWGAALLGITLATAATAAPSQADISREINLVTQAATGVIADLQDRINSGKLAPAAVEAGALRAAFMDGFGRLAGADFRKAPDPLLAEIRSAFSDAFDAVTAQYRSDMLKGGQDAFVPAFFRAQLLDHVNRKSHGRYTAIVTTRSSELINRDSAPDKVIADKAVLAFVADLLEKGELEPRSTSIGARLVSYWPMKVGEPCAACHQRSGLEQKVGAFGGATIVVVEPAR